MPDKAHTLMVARISLWRRNNRCTARSVSTSEPAGLSERIDAVCLYALSLDVVTDTASVSARLTPPRGVDPTTTDACGAPDSEPELVHAARGGTASSTEGLRASEAVLAGTAAAVSAAASPPPLLLPPSATAGWPSPGSSAPGTGSSSSSRSRSMRSRGRVQSKSSMFALLTLS